MNYDLFWLIVCAYKRELITRQEFIKHWKGVQIMQGALDETKTL